MEKNNHKTEFWNRKFKMYAKKMSIILWTVTLFSLVNKHMGNSNIDIKNFMQWYVYKHFFI